MDFYEEVGEVTDEQCHQLYQQVILPEPPDVRRDASAYLATAADTRATALVEGLLEEVGRLDTETSRLREEVTAHEVARMPEGNQTRCRRCLPSVGVRVQCEDCRRIDRRAAEIRAADAAQPDVDVLRGLLDHALSYWKATGRSAVEVFAEWEDGDWADSGWDEVEQAELRAAIKRVNRA